MNGIPFCPRCCCFLAPIWPHEWHTAHTFITLVDVNDRMRAFHTVSHSHFYFFDMLFTNSYLTGVETANKFPLSIHFTTIDFIFLKMKYTLLYSILYYSLRYSVIEYFFHVLSMLLLFWNFVTEEKAREELSWFFPLFLLLWRIQHSPY